MEKYFNGRQLNADSKYYEGYSRYIDEEERYESWDNSIDRVMDDMHYKFYEDIMTPDLKVLMEEVREGYKEKLFLGAQRGLQFGGEQLLKHHARIYNCASTHCDRPAVFGETMYLLLCGAGVGFSVQKQHIAKLPKIEKRTGDTVTFIVPDSIEGWSQAIDVLMSSFFVNGKYPEYKNKKIYFDLSEIRPKGSFISGGFKAPGPEPLRKALDNIELLIKKQLTGWTETVSINGENTEKIHKPINFLKPIVAYDIIMYLGDAVISGGVRRSATICMFSKDDDEMIKAKTGNWFTENPQRGRSNNSAMLLRNETTYEEFAKIMESVKHSGEPGFIWVDDLDFTLNPCVEVGMRPIAQNGESGFQVCNLTEINGSKTLTKEIFLKQCKLASIMGTLQAGYTDFKYLSQATKEIVDREALIGVGITGFMNNPQILTDENILKEGARVVKKWNKITAELIGINQASRTTVVKPSGNASVMLGTASGIHGEHSPLYIRHTQFNKESEIAQAFIKNNPDMCEDSVWNREQDIVVAFPVVSPETSIYKKDLLGVKQLEYVKLVQNSWIEEGTNEHLCVDKRLRHNVSNTITVDDWDAVTDYIYENRNYLCGVSLLAASGDKAYPQAPFTEIFTHEQIVEKYGEVSLFTSALIEAGLQAFGDDLWQATSTALGYGDDLTVESKENVLKRDFVRRFNKFSKHFLQEEFTTKEKLGLNYLEETKANALSSKVSIEKTLEILKDELDAQYLVDSINPELDVYDEYQESVLLMINTKESEITILDNTIDIATAAISKDKVYLAKHNAKEECANCLKDVYNLHKWWRIQNSCKDIDLNKMLVKKTFTDIDTMGAQACAGGACEVV